MKTKRSDNMDKKDLVARLRTVPDFPIKGIQFRDITTLLKDPEAFRTLVDMTYELYKDKGITKVVGIESRGFIIGAALAYRLGAGFVLARKPGKLPAETLSVSYDKEYGKDSIEIHADAITPDDVVLIHDDLLATGGTVAGAIELVRKFSPRQIHANFIIELADLPGRDKMPSDVPVTTLLKL